MSDPRASVNNVSAGLCARAFAIDNSAITYSATAAGGSASVGLAVTLSTDDTITLAGDGELVLGKLLSVNADNFASVQVCGVCTLPAGDSAVLTLGNAIVGALNGSSAEGYVRAVDYTTVAELGHARGIILNAATTTAVVVDLC